jgi:hypothetical protein
MNDILQGLGKDPRTEGIMTSNMAGEPGDRELSNCMAVHQSWKSLVGEGRAQIRGSIQEHQSYVESRTVFLPCNNTPASMGKRKELCSFLLLGTLRNWYKNRSQFQQLGNEIKI